LKRIEFRRIKRKSLNGGPFWHLLREEVNQKGSVGASFKRGLKKGRNGQGLVAMKEGTTVHVSSP